MVSTNAVGTHFNVVWVIIRFILVISFLLLLYSLCCHTRLPSWSQCGKEQNWVNKATTTIFFIYFFNSIYNNNINDEVSECPFSIEPKARTTNIPTKRCKVPDTQNSHAAHTNVSLISLSLHLHTLHSSLAGNSGRLTWLRLQQLQEQCYPFRTVCVIFLCIQTKVWLPGLGIFHMRTDVNARNCTWLAVVCVCLCAFVCVCVCVCVCALKQNVEEKSLAAQGNRTCLNGMSVWSSTNWATSPPQQNNTFLQHSFYCYGI